MKEQCGKSPVVLLHHPRKYLRVLEIQLQLLQAIIASFFIRLFSHGHVPFSCHHCQMENRTNRKSNRGPYGNEVQHANVMVGQYLIRN